MQLIPAPLPELSRRSFSFEPPIAGVEPNDWVLRRATWNDLVVLNTRTSQEMAVPRRFIEEIFDGAEESTLPGPLPLRDSEPPQPVVALSKPLEYRSGRALPVGRGIVEMPPRDDDRPAITRIRDEDWQAPVVAIRVEPESESKLRRALKGSLAVGFLACLTVVFVVRDAHLGTRLGLSSGVLHPLPLTAEDDYTAVINKLGRPAGDRWLENPNGGGYRRLWYPRKRMAVILSGETRESVHYAGTLGRDGSVIHSAVPSALAELTVLPPWR